MRKILFSLIAICFVTMGWGQVSVTATSGTLGPTTYTTINGTSGAFAAINAGTHKGTITITITADYTEVAATGLLKSSTPSSYTSITIKPSGNRVITGPAASNDGAIIYLLGADNVTIDGDDPATAGTRNLSIISPTSSSATQAVIRLSSNSTTGLDGADNNTIKNCIIKGSRSLATSTTVNYGIVMTEAGTNATGAYSSVNTVIQNNEIVRCWRAIYANGASSTYPITGIQILDNSIGSSVSADNIGSRGIYLINTAISGTGALVRGNDISVGDYGSTGYGASIAGIEISSGNYGITVDRNSIHDISQPVSTGYGAYGIIISGSASNTSSSFTNNIVRDISMKAYQVSTTSTFVPAAIYFSAGATGVNFIGNTIQMGAQLAAGNWSSYCIHASVNGVRFTKFQNNILVNNHSSSSAYCFYTNSTSNISGGTIDNNCYYAPNGSANIGYYNAAARNTMSAWQTATAKDASSINLNPPFKSLTDLHLDISAVSIVSFIRTGASGTGVSFDFDGDTRAATPCIGADELLAPLCAVYSLPLNGAANQTQTGVELSWASIVNATSYDVYFDQSADPSTLVSSSQLGTSYLTGSLSASTTYFWKIVPKNPVGSASGCSIWSFTTQAAVPTLSTSPSSLNLGNQCVNTTTATALTFSITALNLTGTSVTISAPPNFTLSEDNITFSSSITVNHSSGSFTNKTIYVKYTPTAIGSSSGNVIISGAGLSSDVNVSVSGVGVNSVSGLSYGSSTVSYCTGNAILANTTTLVTTGGTVTYSVSPSLPSGLALNASTGTISGTPTAASSAADYVVTASNGCSSATSTVNITVVQSPTAPTSSAATNVAPFSFTANWSLVSGATSYLLDVSGVSNFSTFTGSYNGLDVGNVSSVSVTGLTSGTTYYYRVRAVTGSCVSPNSTSQTTGTTAITTITSGNWNSGTTWNSGQVPTCTDNITILSTHAVTVNSIGNVSRNLTINSGGTLIVSSGDLTVGCTLNNTPLSNSGTLTVSGGTLTINGNLACQSGSTFNQSAGDIIVDGNAGGVTSSSVLTGTNIVRLNTNLLNLTGGQITIVDPHAGSSTSDYSVGYSSSSHYASGAGHTFKFGNGSSTDPGGHTNGFYNYLFVSTGYFSFGNVIVDALNGTNRFVKSLSTIGIMGNLSILSGQYQLSSTTYIAGNIVNNASLISTSTLRLGTWTNGAGSATANEQMISGIGSFDNSLTSRTASLSSLTVQNSSLSGVTISVPLSISGTLTMTAGKINTSSSSILSLGTSTSAGTLSYTAGHINGPFERTFAAGISSSTLYGASVLFPVGDGGNYKPIHIDPATSSTGAVVFRAQSFTGNSGSSGAGVGNLSNNRWEALVTNGVSNLTSCLIGLNDATISSGGIIAQSTTANGTYNTISSASTYVSSPVALRTATAIAAASYSGYFTHAPVAPVITSFTPASGCSNASASITITGTNLSNATSVTLNGEACTIVSNTATQIQITTDATPQAGNIIVTTASGSGTSSTTFTLLTPPTVSASFDPQSTICSSGSSTLITASGASTYTWSPSTGLSGTSGSSVTASPSATTTYTITGTDGNGCQSSTTATVTVNTAVSITVPPSSAVVLSGANATFSVTATGTGLTYQWQVSTDNEFSWSLVSDGGIYSGASTNTLTLTGVTTQDGYKYRVLVMGTAPCTNVFSNTVLLTISSTAISVHPQNQTICSSSGSASFSITTTGTTPTYQWQISTDGGSNWSDISGETASSFSLTGLTLSASGNKYRCSLNGGTLNSNSATLTVFDPPAISSQPSNLTVCSNATSGSFTVSATGSNLTYQWQRSTDGGGSWADLTGETAASLSFSSFTSGMDSYKYRVIVSGSSPCTSATSSVATLNVTGISTVSASASTICLGAIVTLSATPSSSSPTLTYTWSSTTGSGASTPIMGSPVDVVPTTAGSYTYTLTSTGGTCTLTNTVAVTVSPVSVGGTASAATSTFCQSGSTTLTLTGNTGGIQWQSSTDNTSFSNISSATASTLSTGTISTTTYYRAVVTNSVCSSVNSNTVTVAINNPQVLTTTPGSICATSGTVTLGATASAGATLKWYAASSGGATLGTGSTFTTPSISSSTPYYVAAEIGSIASVGPTNPTAVGTNASSTATTYYQQFDISSSATRIRTVDIYPRVAAGATFSIAIQNSSGVQLFTTGNLTTTVASGQVQTVNINYDVPVGTGYRMIFNTNPGMTRNSAGAVYPYTSGNVSITGNNFGATYYYFFYNWVVSPVDYCVSNRTSVTATVTSAPSISASASTSPICEGLSTTLNASSTNSGYSYSWNNSAGSGASVSVSPTTTTTYTVTATDNSGGANNGCTTSANVSVSVNPKPNNVSISPASTAVCIGTPQTLTASGGLYSQTILTENFDTDAPNWTTTLTAGAAGTRFYYQASPFTDATGSATFSSFSTSQGGKFALGNADAGSSGVTSNTTLVSPTFSTVGFTTASLSFEHAYRSYSADVTVAVEISTDGGDNWSVLQNYKGTSVGTTTNNAQTTASANLSLASYLNQSNLKIRFNYVSAWGYYWIIDNVSISGTGPGTYTWTSTPSGFTATGSTASISPIVNTTYTVTSTTNAGCTSSNTSAISANTPATVNAGSGSSICAGNTITLSGATASNYSALAWTTSGGGSFQNGSTLTPIYSSSLADAGGSVTLTLTATGNSPCPSVTSTIQLSHPLPLNNSLAADGETQTLTMGGSAVFTSSGCLPIVKLASNGSAAVDGSVTSKVMVDASVQSINGQPYLQRHVDILPSSNASTATGTVTLYASQPEFDAFNTARGNYPALPTGPTDAAGISNVRVTKFGGTSTTGLPGSYSDGTALLIDPDDANVIWNASKQYWEISFSVTGFSGFFIHSPQGSFALPVRLLNLSGYRDGLRNQLNWLTATETNNQGFEVQRSSDGSDFQTIGFVRSLANGGNSQSQISYGFIDASPKGLRQYYRLKQVDIDGKSTLSNILLIQGEKPKSFEVASVYPNPTSGSLTVLINAPYSETVPVQIFDLNGRLIQSRQVVLLTGINSIPIDLSKQSNGKYLISVGGKTVRVIRD